VCTIYIVLFYENKITANIKTLTWHLNLLIILITVKCKSIIILYIIYIQ